MVVYFENAYGALLGVCVGDAAGAVLEFLDNKITNEYVDWAIHMPGGGTWNVGGGQITDDGELTLCLAKALLDHNPTYGVPLEAMAHNYVEWAWSRPFDIGGTCRRAFTVSRAIKLDNGLLSSLVMGNAARHNEPRASNGSLMRVIPIAIWACRQPISVIAHFARIDAMLSHPNRICQDVNALYCIAVAHLIKTPGDNLGAFTVIEEYIKDYPIHPYVAQWVHDAKSKKYISKLNCDDDDIGYCKYGFILALHFLYHNASFVDAIKATLLKGGDTDTNAAIVGGMIGALHGASHIPDYMSRPVLNFDCTADTGRKRPNKYSAKNLESLAYSLIRAESEVR